MARPQDPDYEQRRDAILNAASALYASKGFHATSVADVAAACKISKALLYHYFVSKEDLLFELMDSHLRGLLTAAHTVEAHRGTPNAKILAFSKVVMERYQVAQSHHTVLLNELESLPAPRRAEIVRRQRELVDIADRLLLGIRPDLKKKRGERRVAVWLYIGMLNWTHTWFDPAGEVSADRIAEMATRMFIRGMSID